MKNSFEYAKTFLKWLALSAVVGIICGIVGSLFHESVEYVTHIREANKWIILFLPLGGILIAFLYQLFKKNGILDTNRVIEAVQTEKSVPTVMIPLIFISTVITHFLGGSAGREGAALQLGGSIGYNTSRLFKLNKGDTHIIVMAGMSALFSALFCTPLTAAVFALEVICIGVIHYAAFVPCVMASIVAYMVSVYGFNLTPMSYSIAIPKYLPETFFMVILFAILFALVSIFFCTALKKSEHYMQKAFKNVYLKAFCGGIMIVLLTFLLNTTDYNGAGMNIVDNALLSNVKYEAFLLKIIFTAITIGAGFKGGEIVPSFFIGATFGCLLGKLFGIDAGFAAALGMVSVFCGVTNCPLASVVLSVELFGADGILFFALSCAISFMLSGNFGLYKSQKIAFSKLNEDYIDIRVR